MVGLLTGCALGAILVHYLRPADKKSRELEKRLDEEQQRLKNYQNEVEEHFHETALLVNQLSESYRLVHNHLANGAQNLCDATVDGPRLAQLHGNDQLPGNTDTEAPVSPPLDYAPRSAPDEKGMLTEDFGLDGDSENDQGPGPLKSQAG
jgi:uncharacterized membrane-anchored protein YhcB (DUF1043 family)